MPQASKAIPIYIGWQKGNYPRVNSSQTLHLESRNVQEITANPYGQKKDWVGKLNQGPSCCEMTVPAAELKSWRPRNSRLQYTVIVLNLPEACQNGQRSSVPLNILQECKKKKALRSSRGQTNIYRL